MIFKRLYAKNFMSIGEDPVIIDFDQYGNEIVIVEGKNLDIGPLASNAVGKSLISAETIVFGLFDKTIRGISKEECVNEINKKGLHVELIVDNVKVIRQRQPKKFRIFHDSNHVFGDDTEETLSSDALTQKRLEELLGINFHTFVNTHCFGQHNAFSFLTVDAKTRRVIVENLLNLDKYNLYEENARKLTRDLKSEISDLTAQYSRFKNEIEAKNREINVYTLKLWSYKTDLENSIENLNSKIKSMDDIDSDKEIECWNSYDKSRKQVEDINEILAKINAQIIENQNKISLKLNEIKPIDRDLEKIINLKSGVRCDKCYQTIDPNNYAERRKELEKKKSELQDDIKIPDGKLHQLEMKKEIVRKEISDLLATKKPNIPRDLLIKIKTEKDFILKEIDEKTKKLRENPYHEIIDQLKIDLTDIQSKITQLKADFEVKEKILPYYEFWTRGFGEKGIKSFSIEKIIPVLNAKVNYWLQFLIDNKIMIKFDKYLNVEITRSDGLGKFTYEQGSGGEKKRIDLAIMLSFAHVMALRANITSNVMFLDELAESIDTDGVEGMYRALNELSRTKTIFLITHRTDLLSKFESRKRISIVKENGFSRIVNN